MIILLLSCISLKRVEYITVFMCIRDVPPYVPGSAPWSM